jgi:hypothetical protein
MTECSVQLDKLMHAIDIKGIHYEKMIFMYSSFLKILIAESINDPNINTPNFIAAAQGYLDVSESFFAGRLNVQDLELKRVEVWNLYDQEGNAQKKALLRAIVCCLYQKDAGDGDVFGSDDLFELFFSCLSDIQEKYCKEFREYSETTLQF